jgi:flagellar basal body rod protein FlgG
MRIDTALSGFNTAVRRQDFRANNVANLNTPGYQALDATPVALPDGGVALGPARASAAPAIPGSSNVDLVEEQAGTLLNLRTAQANANILRAQDELRGETLDLLA